MWQVRVNLRGVHRQRRRPRSIYGSQNQQLEQAWDEISLGSFWSVVRRHSLALHLSLAGAIAPRPADVCCVAIEDQRTIQCCLPPHVGLFARDCGAPGSGTGTKPGVSPWAFLFSRLTGSPGEVSVDAGIGRLNPPTVSPAVIYHRPPGRRTGRTVTRDEKTDHYPSITMTRSSPTHGRSIRKKYAGCSRVVTRRLMPSGSRATWPQIRAWIMR